MITLDEAKEQLLSQIELELSRIYDANSKAPEKLQEFTIISLNYPYRTSSLHSAGKMRVMCV